eukprot:ANDGO_06263.mRNA.1 hypothetical protein
MSSGSSSQAIIIECGRCFTRIGFVGDPFPRHTIQSPAFVASILTRPLPSLHAVHSDPTPASASAPVGEGRASSSSSNTKFALLCPADQQCIRGYFKTLILEYLLVNPPFSHITLSFSYTVHPYTVQICKECLESPPLSASSVSIVTSELVAPLLLGKKCSMVVDFAHSGIIRVIPVAELGCISEDAVVEMRLDDLDDYIYANPQDVVDNAATSSTKMATEDEKQRKWIELAVDGAVRTSISRLTQDLRKPMADNVLVIGGNFAVSDKYMRIAQNQCPAVPPSSRAWTAASILRNVERMLKV